MFQHALQPGITPAGEGHDGAVEGVGRLLMQIGEPLALGGLRNSNLVVAQVTHALNDWFVTVDRTSAVEGCSVDTGHHQLTVDDQVWHARYALLLQEPWRIRPIRTRKTVLE